MCFLLCLNGTPLWANPTGGVITAGNATIGNAGTTTTINQSTANAIINWQQFSIGSNEATKFFVPNASAATLNRVLGGNPSAIYGALSSNGKLILVNPSGIVVGPGGRIDTAGFIGSTLDVSDDDFLKGGNLHFLGDGTGAIDNEGTIHASNGDVYLLAGQVTNGGTISAPRGTAGLAAGTDIWYQQAGDQHLFVQSTPLGAKRATGVTNTGTIRAATAELKAAGGNAYALAINNAGQITATGFKKVNGQVYLVADGAEISNSGQISASDPNGNGGAIVLNGYGTASPGTVLSSGKLVASGDRSGATGGTVEVLGNQVGITDEGVVDVSGDAGGGTVLLGGDEHGANAAVPDADQTYLGPDATIDADALTLGNGGKVVLWGNETTQAYGAISARGGEEGGNGGYVETSAQTLQVGTAPDLAAPRGTDGSWLLDPSSVLISDNTSDSGYTATQPAFTLSADSVTINQTTLLDALENGDVTIDASTGSGNGNGTITWSTSTAFDPTLSAATTLTLDAPVSIDLENVAITTTGAALNLVLNSSLSGAGSVQLNNSTIALNGGSFTANGNGYVSAVNGNGNIDGVLVSNSTINAQGGSISLTGDAGYGNYGSGVQAGNGVYLGGGQSFTTELETSGSGNIGITATFDQSISTSDGIDAFNMYAGTGSSDSISVAGGLLSITGNVLAGTATETNNQGSNLTGVEVGGGSLLQATAAGGSITLMGDASGGTALPSGTTSNLNTAGVSLEGGGDGTTMVSLVGANNGMGGILTLHGTGGTLNTSNSGISGGYDLPYSTGVSVNDGVTITTGTHATIDITGTGGAVTTTGAYTGGSTGVSLDGGSDGAVGITMGTSGTLTILGFGSAVNAGDGANASDASTEGVALDGGTDGDVISLATGGSISITGTGGMIDNHATQTLTVSKDNPDTEGVSIDSGAQVEAAGTTTITVMGTSGNITAGNNANGDAIGVNIGSGDGSTLANTLVSSGSGEIMITGIAGSTPSLGIGAEVHGFGERSAKIESTSGSIVITGTGGAGYAGNGTISGDSVPNYGVAILDGATLMTGGPISITGTGGIHSPGVAIEEVEDATFDSSPVLPILQSGGALTVKALSGTGEYVNGTITAVSATFGAETTPGNAATITSGNLTIDGATVTLTGGSLTAFGAGYASSMDQNGNPDGIDIEDSTLNTQGGPINSHGAPITLVGTGGYVFDGTDYYAGDAVLIESSADSTTELETTGSSGNITITGTDDNALDVNSGMYGVEIFGPGTTLSVGSGLLSITGKVLAGSAVGPNEDGATLIGVEVGNGAQLTATTGSGSIDIQGDVSGASSTVSGSNFSFVAGVEIGSNTSVGVVSGTITIDGTGASMEGSSYTGENGIFTEGVQIDGAANVTGGANAQVIVDGTQNSGTTATGADMLGTLVDGGANVSVGNGGEVSLTGSTPGSSVTSGPDGNSNIGLEVDTYSSDVPTSVTVGTNGTLVLMGTGGAVDATGSSGTDGQSGSAGVYVDDGSTITAGIGTGVTITGTGGAATTTSGFVGESAGVVLSDSTLTLDGNNVTAINGTGGAVEEGTNVGPTDSDPAKTDGVAIESGSLVSVGDGSALTVIGHAGGLTATNASVNTAGDNFPGSSGVSVRGDIEATGDGTITLTGYGGNVTDRSTFGSSFGVDVGSDNNDVTISSETGGITITGTAGSSPNLGIGIALHGFGDNVATIESTSGTISLTGTGGSGNSGPGNNDSFFEPNYGVALLDDVVVKSTAVGNISITGTDGSGDVDGAGVAMIEIDNAAVDPSPVSPQINAAGALTIDALAGAGTGPTDVTLGTITADSLNVNVGTSTLSQTGPMDVSSLSIAAAGSVDLDNPGNNISSLDAVAATGSILIYTDPGLILNDAVSGSGPITIESIGGDLTLGPNSSIADLNSGNVTLVTDHDFINNSTAGAQAVTTNGGNYYIYSADPGSTNLNGLPVAFTQYNSSYPSSSSSSGNGVFYASNGPNTGGNTNQQTTTTTTNNGPPSGDVPGSGSNDLPPQITPQTPTLTFESVIIPSDPGSQPQPFGFAGTGNFNQGGPQSGGLAFASGNGGQVAAGDTAQMNGGHMDNVSNPHASGALDAALSFAVHETLQEALVSVGDLADSYDGGSGDTDSTTTDDDTQIVGDGGVVEIGDGSVKQIPLSSAPQPLQDALGNGVMQGLQPAGH